MNYDVRPQYVRWRIYAGDPAELRLHLTMPDGSPADVDGWAWAGAVGTSPPTAFECYPEPDGLVAYLRGEDTTDLVDQYWPFDITGRDPAAGEGRTVLRGHVNATPRVTRPLAGVAPAARETFVSAAP
jgi:hypothetical protein